MSATLDKDVKEIICKAMYTFRDDICEKFNLDISTLHSLFLFDNFLIPREEIVQDEHNIFVYYILDKDGNKYIKYNHLLDEMTYVYDMYY